MVREDPFTPESKLFECPNCGHRESSSGGTTCSNCGGGLRNIAVPRE